MPKRDAPLADIQEAQFSIQKGKVKMDDSTGSSRVT